MQTRHSGATDGKGMMGWCHGFKLHLLCNDSGGIITFYLTGVNVDDRDKRVWTVFAKELYGKGFDDRGYIKQALFKDLFDSGIHFVHGLKANMKNRLMYMWDRIMLRKRCIIECINDLLKNKENIVHSRHRSIHNFIMNICAALTVYSFFENKPEVLSVRVEKTEHLTLFETGLSRTHVKYRVICHVFNECLLIIVCFLVFLQKIVYICAHDACIGINQHTY